MAEHTSTTSTTPPVTALAPELSERAVALLATLRDYRRRFAAAADGYDGTTTRAADLEDATAGYSALVTDPSHEAPFAELLSGVPDAGVLVDDLRRESARCAALMEKFRVLRLLDGTQVDAGYFTHVESCIDSEFGALAPTAHSQVLLVGSGSFPMTLLNVARRTGAAVAGVDIDTEAVVLSRRAVSKVAPDVAVTLEAASPEHLPFTAGATHVVFSSTVAAKYELLDRLHAVTPDDVVMAMRFGDGLKSLFNYPMEDVDPRRWQLADTLRRPGQVFDVALYVKVGAAS